MSTDPHGPVEINIFKRFARSSKRPFIIESIQKRDPPEPDILCEIEGEGKVAFEMVRLIDKDNARRMDFSISTLDEVKKYHNNLPKPDRKNFDVKYSNANIHFLFIDGVKTELNKSLDGAFKHLLEIPRNFVGDTYKSRKKSLRKISITRNPTFIGPLFDTNAVGFAGDPTIESIYSKINKHYESNHSIELLAHFNSCDIFPDEFWVQPVKSFLSSITSIGMFKRIWFFDESNEIIKDV